MGLQIGIIIGIFIQIIVDKMHRVAGAVVGLTITSAMFAYGMYLYKNTNYVISWRGNNLSENNFIIFIMFWYTVDVVFLIKAILAQKKLNEGNIKITDNVLSTPFESSIGEIISNSQSQTIESKAASDTLSLNAFLGFPAGRFHWQRGLMLFLAYIISLVITQVALTLCFGTNTPKISLQSIWIGSIFFLSIFTSFQLFSKKAFSIHVIFAVVFYLLLLAGTITLNHPEISLPVLLKNLLPSPVKLVLFLILSKYLLIVIKQPWLVALLAMFSGDFASVLLVVVVTGMQATPLLLLRPIVFAAIFSLPLFLVPPKKEILEQTQKIAIR